MTPPLRPGASAPLTRPSLVFETALSVAVASIWLFVAFRYGGSL